MLPLKRTLWLWAAGCTLAAALPAQTETYATGNDDRSYMVATLQRIARPVLLD